MGAAIAVWVPHKFRVRVDSGAKTPSIAVWVPAFLTFSNSLRDGTIGIGIAFNVVDFQEIDKTAVASKFGHTTYADIYMGERLDQTRAHCARASVSALSGVGFVSELWLLDPFSLPCCIIVYLVRGLGPVPFAHDESGSWSQFGAVSCVPT